MFIYPVYLINLVLILIIYRIDKLMNDGNRYFLAYLNLHFIFQLITTLNISFFNIFGFSLPVVLVSIGRVLAFVFFLLFMVSLFKNKKASLNFLYFIPCLILILVNHLNGSKEKVTNFISNNITSKIFLDLIQLTL